MSTRLRRTFHYPSDSDSDSDSRNVEDELDDAAQSALIADLAAQDARSAAIYRIAFTALPAVAALLFLPSLLARGSRLTSLLAVSSLLASAWTVWRVPLPPREDRKGKRVAVEPGPVERYLPSLNGGLAGVLGLYGFVAWGRGETLSAVWGLMPLVIYAVVMVARYELRPVDIKGLERLRYEYRGA
ncbi:hypothetical protein K461DRAFT_78533 [Myriangium duriaei CBS 260.36]|uniref:Uncharacterized protein n=1 Tax=Myriangium duriaei CBS 260.36 TaxID=1168546 RepID=A0A9P4J7Q0_9PEZI|nr:hypothetical protein K461DRAFT_78533 [Myriangium duriaei CBS 260.36]